jgi:hypothetical protein
VSFSVSEVLAIFCSLSDAVAAAVDTALADSRAQSGLLIFKEIRCTSKISNRCGKNPFVCLKHLSDGSPWSRQQFPNATILEIRPQQSLNRATGLMSGSQDLLGFDVDKIPTWIEQGYRDTLYCVGRVIEVQTSRNDLRASEAALAGMGVESARADSVLAGAMTRLI